MPATESSIRFQSARPEPDAIPNLANQPVTDAALAFVAVALPSVVLIEAPSARIPVDHPQPCFRRATRAELCHGRPQQRRAGAFTPVGRQHVQRKDLAAVDARIRVSTRPVYGE